MNACEYCQEYNDKPDCKRCTLGNPCLGCLDYDLENDKCLSNGECGIKFS